MVITKPKLLLFFLLVYAVLVGGDLESSKVVAQTIEKGASASQHAKYLVSGWRAEREKPFPYDVRIMGHEQNYNGITEDGKSFIDAQPKKTIDLRLLRDDAAKKFRSEVLWGQPGEGKGIWIEAGSLTITYLNAEMPVVDLFKPEDARPAGAIRIQPEALGLLGIKDSLELSVSNSRDYLSQAQKIFFDDNEVVWVTSPRKEVFTVRFAEGLKDGDRIVHDVTFNETQGFSIERRISGVTSSLEGDIDLVVDEVNTSWANESNNWVPTKLDEIHRNNYTVANISLKWSPARFGPEEQLFSLKSINPANKAMIVDHRLGMDKSIVLGYTGNPVAVPPIPDRVSTLSKATLGVVAVGAILAIIAIIVVLVRVKRSR